MLLVSVVCSIHIPGQICTESQPGTNWVGLRDAPFNIWGGGGARKNMKKKQFVTTKIKKIVENVGRKIKFVVEIQEKYVDQKKTRQKNIFDLFDKT